MVRIIHGLIGTVASSSIQILTPCLHPQLASLAECDEAKKVARQIRLTKTLYDRLTSVLELNTDSNIYIYPTDGILMDSLIDRAIEDLDEGERMIIDLLNSSEYSTKFLNAVFDRRIAYLESSVRAHIQLAINRATESTVKEYEQLEKELFEIEAKFEEMHAESRNRAITTELHYNRFDIIERWTKKYKEAIETNPNEYFPDFAMYKKIFDEKIDAIFEITDYAKLDAQKREVIRLLSSLESKGMSFHLMWRLCRESYEKITSFLPVMYEKATIATNTLNARHFQIVNQLVRLHDSVGALLALRSGLTANY